MNKLFFPLSFPIVLLAFNNCSQPGEISLESSPRTLNTELNTNELNFDDQTEQILKNCQLARHAGLLKTLDQALVFNNSREETGLSNICPFASEQEKEDSLGNLTMLDGQLRARYEQQRDLNIPENAIVCNMSFSNDLQRFRYDDVFLFTFNNHVLATNDKHALQSRLKSQRTHFTESNKDIDIFAYDWKAIRTAHFENVADDYCLGADQGLGSCSWPISEEQGQIKFRFEPEIFIRLDVDRPSPKHTFKFIITGDNDPSVDCFHEELKFNMHVEYYLK